jgi:protocatechuate 3,4-dioxygenase beta subunit
MEQSQLRHGQVAEQFRGRRRIKKQLIVAAALMTAAGVFLSFEGWHNDTFPASRGVCEGKNLSSPVCAAPNAAAQFSADVAESMGLQESREVYSLPSTRNRSPRRAWQQDEHVSNLLADYTLVEVCTNSSDLAVSGCQGRTLRDLRPLTSAGVSDDEEKRLSISGEVLSSEGESLEGVRVVALPERLDNDTAEPSESLRFWTMTDPLGKYSFRGLPPGEYMIRSARLGPYYPARVSARTGSDYADLVMSRKSQLVVEGRVVGSFGEPLEGVTVFPTLLGQASVQTGLDGRFELPLSVKPDIASLSLQFRMAGYKDQISRVQIGGRLEPLNEEVRVVMDMVQSWTSVEGMVTNNAGQPLAGRRVELRPQAGRRTQSTTTDASGRYVFDFVESPADYRLFVSGGEGFKDVERELHVTTYGNDADVVAEAYETGVIAGRLVNQNGVSIPGFELVLKNVESRNPIAVVRTDSLGNFEVPAAPAGELVFSSASTPSVLVKGLHLEPGERVDMSLVLDWGDHLIRGQVVDSRGNPVPASRVVLNWSHRDEQIDTQTTRRTATDTQGRFAFSNLGPGPHSLKVDAPGFLGVDIDHDLSRQGYGLTVRLN